MMGCFYLTIEEATAILHMFSLTYIVSSQNLIFGKELEKEMDSWGDFQSHTAGVCTGLTPLKLMTLHRA
jgi:hypothetical protein